MTWAEKLLFWRRHLCPLPVELPVVEDQRIWQCPKCERYWIWTELPGGIGWKKMLKEK